MWSCPALIIFLGQEIIYAWARNAPKLELPPAVGFKVGGPRSDVKFLVLQVLVDAGVIFCHKQMIARICLSWIIAETNQWFPFQVHYASVDKIPADGDRSGVVLRWKEPQEQKKEELSIPVYKNLVWFKTSHLCFFLENLEFPYWG